jgi:hypothetical protein
MQRHLAVLARRAPRRRAWLEPPSKLRHQRMLKVAWIHGSWPGWPFLAAAHSATHDRRPAATATVTHGCRPRLELLSAGLPLSLRVDAVGSGARAELAARWCALAPAQRGVLLVHANASGDGLQWEAPMELDLSRCRRMRLGLPELQLRGLLGHTPSAGAAPPPPTLWAKAHLSFSLLVAPRNPRAAATAAADGIGTGAGTVGGTVGRGGGGAGAQGEELLELHAVARDRQEMLHCYLGLQAALHMHMRMSCACACTCTCTCTCTFAHISLFTHHHLPPTCFTAAAGAERAAARGAPHHGRAAVAAAAAAARSP